MATRTRARQAATFRTPRAAGGFTLVELLIVIILSAVLGGVVVTLMYNYLMLFITSADTATAAQRAGAVIAHLEQPVQAAGLGIPTATSNDFKAVWGTDGPVVKEWSDAVFVSRDSDGRDSGLGVVYAIPTGVKVRNRQSLTAGANTIPVLNELAPSMPLPQTLPPGNLHSWLTFPGTGTAFPVRLTGNRSNVAGSRELDVSAARAGSANEVIPMNQEVLMVRGIWAFVTGNTFYMVDITNQSNTAALTNVAPGSGAIVTKVEGIRAIRFDMDPNRKYLEVRVLAMGDSTDKDTTAALSPKLKDRWSELTDDDRRFLLEEYSVRWRMRNLAERQ